MGSHGREYLGSGVWPAAQDGLSAIIPSDRINPAKLRAGGMDRATACAEPFARGRKLDVPKADACSVESQPLRMVCESWVF